MVHEILRRAAVERATGLSRSSIYALMAAPSARRFPRPVKIGMRSVGWLSSDIQAWQAARIAERDGKKKSAA